MKKTPISNINDSYIIELDRFNDDRGYFQEIFSFSQNKEFSEVAQINISKSKKNVIRGLHVANFAKLCTCVSGSLFDVVADVRENSSTFGKWFGVWLTEENKKQLFVPAGCAHGFFSEKDDTILCYQQSGLYNKKFEFEINYKDPFLSIEWPKADFYILSEKDKLAPNFF
jgi:dTDP-4-dehydrorhamnose 3,5-epimerase